MTDKMGGNYYTGEYRDDHIFHGQGTITYANGDKYVGEFRDGTTHGRGIRTFADGSKNVEEYKDGHRILCYSLSKREAITTKHHGPTRTRHSRSSATSASGVRIYVPYSYDLSGKTIDECHDQAAEALCTKLGWTGQMISGNNITGNVYVFAD